MKRKAERDGDNQPTKVDKEQKGACVALGFTVTTVEVEERPVYKSIMLCRGVLLTILLKNDATYCPECGVKC